MSDAVERVARAIWLTGNNDDKPFGSWDQVPEDPPDEPNTKTLFRDFARMAVYAHNEWLTEQGIPVDKLLSGEMVAAEVLFLEAYDMTDEWRDWHGKPAQEPTGATHSEVWRAGWPVAPSKP